MLQIENLVGGYSKTPILKGVDLTVQKGEFFVLLGPNGSGKTTLFKLVTGQLPIQQGQVLLSNKSIKSYSKLEKAKKIAVLSQEVSVSFDFTVEEIVRLGRYPHQKGILKNLSKKDIEVIDEVMELTKTSQFAKKQFRTLSGGEKQRVLLAKALAQEPELLLLDEPTNHLDIKHTFQLLDLLKERQQKMGLTIFAILHDLNVASLYADRFALLQSGNIVEVGDVGLLRKEDQLQQVYEVEVNAQPHPTVPKPQLLMTPKFSTNEQQLSFNDRYNIKQQNDLLHIEFQCPLRTMSNAHVGDGINWNKHFYQLFEAYEKNVETSGLDGEHVAVFKNCGILDELVVVSEQIDTVSLLVAVSIVKKENNEHSVSVMVFIDSHFTDGELVNGYMVATEAVVHAIHDVETFNHQFQTDGVLLAVTQQQDEKTTFTIRSIQQVIYRATKEAIEKQIQKNNIHLQMA